MKFKTSRQKITKDELIFFEKAFGLNLPKTYQKIILENNGGIPEKPYFQGKKIYFDSIKHGNDPIEDTIKTIKDILPKGFYPFGSDGGGWPFCIDLSEGSAYGKIYFCPMDGNEPEFLANSFEDFMNELSDDDSDY